MTNFRNLVAVSATMAVVALGQNTYSQDDLDDLLNDLESSPAETPKAAEAVEETVEDVAEAVEEKAEEVAEAVEEKAEEVAEAVEEKAEEVAEAVEEKAEDPVDDVADILDDKAEEPAAEVAETVEEPAVEEPAAEVAEAVEEPAVEEPAAEVAEAVEEPAVEEPAAEVAEAVEEPAAEEPAAEVAEAVEEPAPAAKPAAPVLANIPEADREVLENAIKTEELRRLAFNKQALREIDEAHKCMTGERYQDAVRHYQIASKLLNDSPNLKDYRIECEQGIAEGWYRAALQEDATGRREKAKKYMGNAVDLRHPKARRILEAWIASDDPDANKPDLIDIKGVRNDEDYNSLRAVNAQHLKRARQLLGAKQLDRALDECELVIDSDPYNREAISLREKIEAKRHTIMVNERKATREGYMADVDKAWRPPYAVNARKLEEQADRTQKDPLDNDPVRRQEQLIYSRMKEMRLPAISFKPPATIIDAVDFFRGASKDYDRPDIPLEQRGFNFVLKTPEALKTAATSESDDSGFGSGDDEDASASAPAGIPVIPMITASDISFFEALKLVCESVDYKFKVQGSIVMVMHKDMSTEEMVTRSYPVLSTFMDRMDTASSEIKTMKSSGFNVGTSNNNDDGEENQEKDWKSFFEMLGVKWPEGSSIMYIKTIGKLRVKNTYENLAELEKALTEMNADPKLIEIEARFVEVCQDDLNSLGFEWILNSDFALGIGSHLSRALDIRHGQWNGSYQQVATSTGAGSSSGSEVIGGLGVSGTTGGSQTYTLQKVRTQGASWIREGGRRGGVGINNFGGDGSTYATGNRYLSTLSNHISGEGYSTNDQFMRINAFLGGADLSMILHMLSQRSDTDLLSAPKVLTRPGEEAVMKVVTEYIYPTDYDVQLQSSSSSSGGYGGGGGQSAILAVVEPQSFTMREVGVILDVTPTLTDDGNLIDLKLNTQVVDEPTWKNYGMRIPFTGNSNSLQSFQGIGDIMSGLADVLTTLGTGLTDTLRSTFAETAVNSASTALDNLTAKGSDNMTYYDAPMEQPFFHVRSIDSSVSVYPGATIVMGGLITEQRKAMDDKIPLLGDLPIIGRLFRSHSEQTSKRNLLIFVTTRLVDVRGREVTMQALEQKDKTDVTPAVEDVE